MVNSQKEIGEMKAKLIAVLLIMLLAVAGCSSSGEKSTSADSGKLATINTLLSKGYEMSQNQRETINQLVAEGKEFVAQGKQEEADKVFDQAIELLEVIGETDRFNKSE
jgi:Tfp pilus assembly protein PilF